MLACLLRRQPGDLVRAPGHCATVDPHRQPQERLVDRFSRRGPDQTRELSFTATGRNSLKIPPPKPTNHDKDMRNRSAWYLSA